MRYYIIFGIILYLNIPRQAHCRVPKVEEYPFMGYIYYEDDKIKEDGARFYRTAVLVESQFLLTTSFPVGGEMSFPSKTLMARIGASYVEHDFAFLEERGEKESEVIEVIRPVGHNDSAWWLTDIVLLKVMQTQTHNCTLLNPAKISNTTSCSLLHYSDWEVEKTRRLLDTVVTVHPSEECGKYYRPEHTVCSPSEPTTFTKGNSGSPLVCDQATVALYSHFHGIDPKSRPMFQLLKPWIKFLKCGIEEACLTDDCPQICQSIAKDRQDLVENLENLSSTEASKTKEISSSTEITIITETPINTETSSNRKMPTNTEKPKQNNDSVVEPTNDATFDKKSEVKLDDMGENVAFEKEARKNPKLKLNQVSFSDEESSENDIEVNNHHHGSDKSSNTSANESEDSAQKLASAMLTAETTAAHDIGPKEIKKDPKTTHNFTEIIPMVAVKANNANLDSSNYHKEESELSHSSEMQVTNETGGNLDTEDTSDELTYDDVGTTTTTVSSTSKKGPPRRAEAEDSKKSSELKESNEKTEDSDVDISNESNETETETRSLANRFISHHIVLYLHVAVTLCVLAWAA